jgi:5-methylcytosine-specific restriction endonuclease McrA
MTDGLRIYIMGHLRRIGYRNETRKEVFEKAKRGRGRWECAGCNFLYKKTELHGDHINPVIAPERGFENWDVYITNLFEGQTQVLCKSCHSKKTEEENKVRRARRIKQWKEVG